MKSSSERRTDGRLNHSFNLGLIPKQTAFKAKNQTFLNQINQIQQLGNKTKIQQQYIKEEIKYLEQQLKLLRDKQIIENKGAQQFDNFLKDQIPINQNILAIKKEYNRTQQNLNDKIKQLEDQQSIQQTIANSLRREIELQNQELRMNEEMKKEKQINFNTNLKMTVQRAEMKKRNNENLAIRLKQMKQDIKQLNVQIYQYNKKIEKNKNYQIKAQQDFNKKIANMKSVINKTIMEYLYWETQKIISDQIEGNPFLDKQNQQNLKIRKKIMMVQKQTVTNQNKKMELEFIIEQLGKERQKLRQEIQKIQNEFEELKEQQYEIDNDYDKFLNKQINDKMKSNQRKAKMQKKQTQKQIRIIQQRMYKFITENDSLIEQKKQLEQQLEYKQNIQQELQKNISNLKTNLINNISKFTAQAKMKQNLDYLVFQNNKIDPMKHQIQIINQRVIQAVTQIDKANKYIQYNAKKLEMIKQLKELNLQQIKMMNEGGININNALIKFMKKWNTISRTN